MLWNLMLLRNCQAQRRTVREQAKTPPTRYPWHTQKPATSSPARRKMLRPSESSGLPEQPRNKESTSLGDTHPEFLSLPSSLHRITASGTEEATTKVSAKEKVRCFHWKGSQLKRKIEAKVPASKQSS
ncbi:hypothetical protein F2P56_021339 [Juglans regia]|uniref:Uncharacterized protein n=1 Tax=Juglans regia TaxID=51240 RepID=A0A833WMX9_JUGRE|nr:hypothetical protein F2P56_021339 [Juglans regia]